jgi:hypothetical protein
MGFDLAKVFIWLRDMLCLKAITVHVVLAQRVHCSYADGFLLRQLLAEVQMNTYGGPFRGSFCRPGKAGRTQKDPRRTRKNPEEPGRTQKNPEKPMSALHQ